MAEKQNNQRHESTIDKYFSRTADGFKAWAEEEEEERNYLQIALETRLEIQTKTETKDTIFILLTTVKPVTSQTELLNQCKGINSFALSLLKQQKNS